jgi:hypothetical protein
MLHIYINISDQSVMMVNRRNNHEANGRIECLKGSMNAFLGIHDSRSPNQYL